jgi:hypothetical protein
MVKMGRVALNGTNLEANASKHKAICYGRLVDKEEQIEAETARPTTSCPAPRSSRTTADRTCPVAPVTNTRMVHSSMQYGVLAGCGTPAVPGQ